MSDRQKGIDAAISERWPKVGRRYCTRHLSANRKKAFPGPLMMSLFWKASTAYSPFTFRKAMEQIQKLNPLALVWLAQIGPQIIWTRHQFDPNIKSNVNKTNFVESFNATLGIDRCRPILSLLEGIRRNTMVRLATRRQVCETWDRDDICPNIITRVKKLCHDSRTCRPFFSKEGEWEVLDGKSTLPVSLNKHTCLCGSWQISGIPCKHGMRGILAVGLDPHKFVDSWYSVQMYKTSYSYGISSIPDHESWPEINTPNINPPIFRRAAGRPSRNRKRSEDEERK